MRVFMIILITWTSIGTLHADELGQRLEKIIKQSPIAREALGLAVLDLTGAKQGQVFGLNEKQEFTPASVTKLATASTVLQKLGASLKLQTTLSSAGKVSNGTLKGDLVLKGGGDSGFVSESMWFLVNEFVRTGIQKIDGNVIVDDSEFDSIRTDPSRDPERVDRAYDAPVGAMSFNWNSINIFVRPRVVGQPPQVVLDPLGDYYTVENKAKTTSGSGSTIDITRTGSRVRVQGTIGIGHDEVVAYKNVDDPVDWSGRNLVFFLAQRGITVTGKVKSGIRPDAAKLLAKADSKPLAQAVTDMLKFSNNYVAEMLTKDLALRLGKAPANLNAGMEVIRNHLVETVGLERGHFTLLNPSGLSRKNQITPRDLAEVLAQAQRTFPVFAEYLSALPIGGADGTLKRRMVGTNGAGWVRAKTGNLSGVVALAGYAGRKDGGMRAFAFIFNGKSNLGEEARHLFDALAEELVQ